MRDEGSSALAQQFAESAQARGVVLESSGDSRKADVYFSTFVEIYRELKRRGALDALTPMLEHQDPWVRIAGAWALLGVQTERAVEVLDNVSRLQRLAGFSAQMTLHEWRGGRLRHPDAAR